MQRLLTILTGLCFYLNLSADLFAQENFFKGKTIRVIVPFAAGGGYDIYSRIMGRHMGKYIPGNPVFVVDNMTGAGGLIAVNHVYKVAKPDGLTMATPIGTMFVDQLIGKPGMLDLREAVGIEGRWFSPLGPLRVAYGLNLAPGQRERQGVFEFTIGSLF